MENAIDWLRLITLRGLSGRQKRTLVTLFGHPSTLFSSSAARRRDLLGGPAAGQLAALIGNSRWLPGKLAQAWMAKPGSAVIGCADASYPALLHHIQDPPLALFIEGDGRLLESDQVSIVGSRSATPAGIDNAARIARSVAGRSWTVTSGLARGIDAAAHAGAIECGGRTVAVLGCGIDICYPPENRRLYAEVASNHLLVSEYPPGIAPLPHHFPARNRIISGLARATVVIEARRRSGSLITARLAAEQGREVFAVPGPLRAPLSEGCLCLIRDGACPVVNENDVMEALAGTPRTGDRATAKCPDPAAPGLDDAQAAVLRTVDYLPTTVDSLLVQSRLTMEELSYILIKLEAAGLVHQVAGGAYVRIGGD